MQCDLLIIAGTSLTVYPAANLPGKVLPSTRRVVFNKDIIYTPSLHNYNNIDDNGVPHDNYIEQPNIDNSINLDSLVQGDCDELFLALIVECGWLHDLWALKDQLCTNSLELVTQTINEAK